MPRRTANTIPTIAGLAVAAVLIVAGVLLTLGHSFVSNQVYNDLATQKIYFPASNSPAITSLPAASAAEAGKYADQLVTTGPQAQAYADTIMAAQVNHLGGGLSYSQLIDEVAVSRSNAKAAEIQAANVFRAESIRGQLLSSYEFWKVGQVMFNAAFVAFAAAAVLLIVSAFGLAGRRTVEAATEAEPKLAELPVVETV